MRVGVFHHGHFFFNVTASSRSSTSRNCKRLGLRKEKVTFAAVLSLTGIGEPDSFPQSCVVKS